MQFNVRQCVVIVTVLLSSACGCRTGPAGPSYTPAEQKQLLEPILARRIAILEPFTQVRSFDQDRIPDGVEVLLQAFDSQGEAVKLAGNIVFEFFTYREPAADPKNEQIQRWEFAINTLEKQETYWDPRTRLYKFPLLVDKSRLAPGKRGKEDKKYVLVARYNDAWGEHLESQATIDLTGLISQVREEIRQIRGK